LVTKVGKSPFGLSQIRMDAGLKAEKSGLIIAPVTNTASVFKAAKGCGRVMRLQTRGDEVFVNIRDTGEMRRWMDEQRETSYSIEVVIQ